jgi:hypothetical protein
LIGIHAQGTLEALNVILACTISRIQREQENVGYKNTWEEYKNVARRPVYVYLEEST